jgi:hypothetical protein
MTTNNPLTSGFDMSTYLIDIRQTVIQNVSCSSPAPSWMLNSNVLMSLEQTIDLVIAEHLAMAAEFRRAIQVAYVQGLWPNYLQADKLHLTQLSGFSKLEQQTPFPMLQAMHQEFLHAAAAASAFAQAGDVEAAYEVFSGDYAQASLEFVSLLKNVAPRVRVTRERLEKSLALA